MPPLEVSADEVVSPLKPVIRRATAEDISRESLTREREVHALDACKRLVAKLNLPMRLIDAQYTFDGAHLLIHFLADNRVDFRELVRELARELHTRIELRQVGVRDEAKLLGGFGMCGRPLCCATYMNNFAPVAINMAKAQGLALNPQKISGLCGRLMCCLAFEYDHYKEVRVDLPRVNSQVRTPHGVGKVTKLNVLAKQVEVTIPEASAPMWVPVEDVLGLHADAPPCGCCSSTHHGDELGDDVSSLSVETLEAPCTCGVARAVAEPATTMSVVERAAPQASSGSSRRGRRRNKRPAEDKTAHIATDTPSTGEPNPTKPRRRRRKPARPAEQAPVPVAAVEASGGAAEASPAPQRRYRPRRRN
jgi:cell fate regulator YaaT (PSP1 superfamily)